MNSQTRIASIVKAKSLEDSITGFPSFNLSDLVIIPEVDFPLPTNFRLGHLAESVVSGLIKSSSNYKVLYENIQLVEDKTTVGEIDFIIQERMTRQIIHVELAYKFYLFDSSLSSVIKDCWIGPNRNDSLKEKLNKLKIKQFPLLSHASTQLRFPEINIEKTTQALCFLVSLYLPFSMTKSLDPIYEKHIKGYYINIDTFQNLDHINCTYHLPEKKDWGINPSENKSWIELQDIEQHLSTCMAQKQAPLCWRKQNGSFSEFFITWW